MSETPPAFLAAPAAPTRLERAYPWLVALLVLVGAALRVRLWLAARSFWADEAMLALGVSGRALTDLFGALPHDQAAPPGFLLLVRACDALFGASERSLRAVPMALGVLSLPLFASVARRLLSRPAALVALAAFAILEPLRYFANELKPYGPDAFVALAILRAALDALDRPVPTSRGVAYALGGALLVWTSFPAVFGLGAAGLVFATRAVRRGDARGLGRVFAVAGVWGLSFAALYLLTATKAASSDYLHEFWRHARAPLPTSSKALAWYVTTFFEVFHDPAGFVQPSLAAAAALVGLFAIGRRSCATFALLVVPAVLALVASNVVGYPFASRLILFLVPAILLLVGAGLDELRRIPGCPVWLLVAVGVLLAQPAVAAVSEARRPRGREEIRLVLRDLASRVRPGDAVYVYEYGHPQFAWYAAHGAALPDGVEVLRAAATTDALAPAGSAKRFASPVSLADALASGEGRPARARVWALFTHVVTWKGVDEEAVARRTFLDAGYVADTRASEGLTAPGASATLYVRGATVAPPR